LIRSTVVSAFFIAFPINKTAFFYFLFCRNLKKAVTWQEIKGCTKELVLNLRSLRSVFTKRRGKGMYRVNKGIVFVVERSRNVKL